MRSIFISYCRRDAALVDEFLKHLKPVEHLGLIPWVDDRAMTAGQEFHEEIQEELKRCAAAVLVVSPDFLASEYVMRDELPEILRARKERGLLVLPLYLRDCGHRRLSSDLAFSPILALNDPKAPIASLPESGRDAAFTAAVERLLEAMREHAPSPEFDRSDVPILTVALSRRGSDLHRDYHVRERVAEHRAPCALPPPTRVDLLWPLLFPTEPPAARHAGERALAAAFGAPLGPAPTPADGPLRIQLVTDPPEIARLPWTWATWNGRPLWKYGWTIELCRSKETRGVEEIELPNAALLLFDDDAHAGVSGRATAREFVEVWDRTFPRSPDHPTVLHRWPTRADEAAAGRPVVLVYAGRAIHHDGEVRVMLADEHGQPDARPIADLLACGPSVVLLNLRFPSGDAASIPPSAIPGTVPLVVAQAGTADQREALRSARIAWWNDFLAGRDPDPIVTAHRHANVPTQVFSARRRFQFQRREPAVGRLVRLRLDRVAQKTRMQREVQKLFQHGTPRRSCSVIARGGHGNRVDLFHRQLYADLREHAPEEWNLVLKHVLLPSAASFSVDDVATEVRRVLRMPAELSLAGEIRRQLGADEMSNDVCHVVVLAFGIRGGRHGSIPTKESLDAWLEFCTAHLDAALGTNVRVVALLQLEAPDADLDRHVDALRADQRFRKEHFLYLPLDHLDRVPLGDLIEFIDEPDSNCPPDLRGEFPALLHERARGDFDETAEWIERAHRESWYTIADELRAQAPSNHDAARNATE